MTQPVPAQRTSRRLVPAIVGRYAEVFVVSLLAFGCTGLGWGLWRPTMDGTIAEDGGVESIDPVVMNGNREFSTFGVMVFLFLLLGVALAIWMGRKHREVMGPLLLIWGAVCTACGCVTFYVLGTKLALWRVGLPNIEDLHVGSTLTYLPEVELGVAALVAPLAFLIMAWCLAVFESAPDGVEPAEDQ